MNIFGPRFLGLLTGGAVGLIISFIYLRGGILDESLLIPIIMFMIVGYVCGATIKYLKKKNILFAGPLSRLIVGMLFIYFIPILNPAGGGKPGATVRLMKEII